MKKILIDIYHLPQCNFFKNAILAYESDEVDIYCVDRGRLLNVIQHELPGYTIKCIGDYKHNKGLASMIFKIIIPRMVRLIKEIKTNRYRLILTTSWQASLVGKLKGIPSIAFNDDPRRLVFPLLRFSASELYLPPFGARYKEVKFFNALKEWAYLSPNYFTPNEAALRLYDLDAKRYVFIREVSTKTVNYLSQEEDIILSVAKSWPENLTVVLSLENKQNINRYPKDWIILQEPIKDIYSLMYFSQLLISSGDSMAREGAMLGVPSLYVGNRDMPANDILIKKGMLWKIEPTAIIATVQDLIMGKQPYAKQQTFRDSLYREWDDITQLILAKIDSAK